MKIGLHHVHCCIFSLVCINTIILGGHRDGFINKLCSLTSLDNFMLATLFSVAAPIVLKGQICSLWKMASFTVKWRINKDTNMIKTAFLSHVNMYV